MSTAGGIWTLKKAEREQGLGQRIPVGESWFPRTALEEGS